MTNDSDPVRSYIRRPTFPMRERMLFDGLNHAAEALFKTATRQPEWRQATNVLAAYRRIIEREIEQEKQS